MRHYTKWVEMTNDFRNLVPQRFDRLTETDEISCRVHFTL